ncbi:MAG TPA: Zn-dependent hydrolase [Bacillus bacterium]|nr:Zn-dependent hydrolase [Bacillus sp. (in: firmicutes)]
MQLIERIGERFWYMTPVSETDRPILGMVVGNEKTLMIDAGNSEEQLFLEMLLDKQVAYPDFVVLTHWHWDHVFGLSHVKKAISISSVKTKEAIEKMLPLSWSDEALDQRVAEGTEIEFCSTAIKKEFTANRDIKITLPELTFVGKVEIDLGGLTCILQHVGGDHAGDSVVVYIKEEKILFLADSIYPNIFSPKRNYTIAGTLALLDILETFDAETYILSHWKPISKEEYHREAKLLRTIAELTGTLNGQQNKMIEEYKNSCRRELTEDELETIYCFSNGYHM